MIDGIYNGAASLSALERWQAVISQNLSAGAAAGYKKSEPSFDGVRSAKTMSAGNTAGGGGPVTTPTVGSVIDFRRGDLRETGKVTDFAVNGPGFFQVRGAGPNDVAYTRDGEFHINAENTLVTKHGREVLGEEGPLVIDPDEGPLALATDGTLSQGDNIVGRLILSDFANLRALQRVEAGMFAAPRGVAPSVVEQPSILQGVIEASNVSPMGEMVNLVTVSRAYEAAHKMITSHDEMLRQAIQTLGGPTQA